MDSLSLCDVFRVKIPKRKLFTRHNKSHTNMSRIDRINAPKSMIPDAFGYTFDPCSYSDHDLMSVKFNCKRTFDRGPGLWEFNSSLTMEDVCRAVKPVSSGLETLKGKISRPEDLVGHW